MFFTFRRRCKLIKCVQLFLPSQRLGHLPGARRRDRPVNVEFPYPFNPGALLVCGRSRVLLHDLLGFQHQRFGGGRVVLLVEDCEQSVPGLPRVGMGRAKLPFSRPLGFALQRLGFGKFVLPVKHDGEIA